MGTVRFRLQERMRERSVSMHAAGLPPGGPRGAAFEPAARGLQLGTLRCKYPEIVRSICWVSDRTLMTEH